MYVWYNPRMNPTLEEISEKARPVFEKYGVKRARIFGSYARGEARLDSDIDLLLDFEKPLGFEFYTVHEELAEKLGREVDVVTEGNMNKFLRPYIMPDVRPLYEKR